MLEHPNETKINQLYQSQPAMRHNVVIQDLKVRNFKVKIKIIKSSEAVHPLDFIIFIFTLKFLTFRS